VAAAFAAALTVPLETFHAFNISGATPFLEGDCDALMHDAPLVLQKRAPALVEAFAERGYALPAAIDRVYVSAKAEAMLGFKSQHGWEAVLSRDFPLGVPMGLFGR
jgi:UDP-glucose 4-epimerase